MTQRKPIYYPRSFLHVLSQQCETCIFNPETTPLAGPERLRAHLQTCLDSETYAECHHATNAGEQVACRGFWDWAKKTNQEPPVMQIGQRLRLVVEVSQGDLDALARLKDQQKRKRR